MAANIVVTITRGSTVIGPYTNTSVEDLQKDDAVTLYCPDTSTTYAWAIMAKPISSGGDPSSAVLTAPTAQTSHFTVDYDGAYLIRLVVDSGLGTQDIKYVRVRSRSKFGNVRLSAAGERYTSTEQIPCDIPVTGWADTINATIQKVLAMSRRLSTTGRVLYVDANRPKGTKIPTSPTDNPVGDPTKFVLYPGTDQTSNTTNINTGINMPTSAVGDFVVIQDAIDYAANAVSRGEEEPSLLNPYWILIKPGLYVEDLFLHEFVHLVADIPVGQATLYPYITGFDLGWPCFAKASPVVVMTTGATGSFEWNSPVLPSITIPPSFPPSPELMAFLDNLPTLILKNISFENWGASSVPLLKITGTGILVGDGIGLIQPSLLGLKGPALACVNPICRDADPLKVDQITVFLNNSQVAEMPDFMSLTTLPAFSLDSMTSLTCNNCDFFSQIGFDIPLGAQTVKTSAYWGPKAAKTSIVLNNCRGALGRIINGYVGSFELYNTDLRTFGAPVDNISLYFEPASTTPSSIDIAPSVTISNSYIPGCIATSDYLLAGTNATTINVRNSYIGTELSSGQQFIYVGAKPSVLQIANTPANNYLNIQMSGLWDASAKTFNAAGNYVPAADNQILGNLYTTDPITIYLPSYSVKDGQVVVIKNETGTANNYAITITPPLSGTTYFENGTDMVKNFATAWGSLKLYYRAASGTDTSNRWFVI